LIFQLKKVFLLIALEGSNGKAQAKTKQFVRLKSRTFVLSIGLGYGIEKINWTPIDFFLSFGKFITKTVLKMRNFRLKLADRKLSEQEIATWERKVKQLNVSRSFRDQPELPNETLLREVLNDLNRDFDRLHKGFLLYSDTWTYSETEAWTKKYNQTSEAINLHMRLYFLYTGQDYKFS
jgi:hypothetical protein